jgi:hypothetical protein
MSNPDSSVTSNLSAIVTLGGLVVILIIFLFNYHTTPYFNYLLYGGLPILIYLLVSIMNILAQYLSSKPINMSKAFLGGVPSIVITYFALLLSYISYARIPIASVIVPLFLDTSVNVVANPTHKSTTTANANATANNNANNQPGAPKQYLPPTIASQKRVNLFGGMLTSLHQATSHKQTSKKGKKYTGGACCSPTLTLEDIEHDNPFIKGISYAFYIFFAICFGGIFGTRIALT